MMKWRRLHRVNRQLWEHNIYLQDENLRLRRELAERDGTTMPVIPPGRVAADYFPPSELPIGAEEGNVGEPYWHDKSEPQEDPWVERGEALEELQHALIMGDDEKRIEAEARIEEADALTASHRATCPDCGVTMPLEDLIFHECRR